jgi:hypothetical protein
MNAISKLLPWVLSAGVAWSLGFLYNVRYGGELSWLRRVYEEKVTLLNQIDAPGRIIFAGGSGVQYSINSEYVEKHLGMPVFNFGLQGDIGLNVTSAMILEKVKPNDIVVLIPEYLMLTDEDGFGQGETLFGSGTFAWAIGKPWLGGLGVKKLVEDAWLLGVPGLKILTRSAVQLAEQGKVTGYFSDPITGQGDPTFVKPRVGKWWKMTVREPVSRHSLQRIEQFQQELAAKGAHLVVSLAWLYADTEDPETRENVRLSAEKLEKIVPTVYNKENLNLKGDASIFADTHYHLLPPARLVRSQELVEQLKPVLKEFKPSPTQTSLR